MGTGTYYISADNAGCVASGPVNVTINTTPTLTLQDTTDCTPTLIDLTDLTYWSTDVGTLAYWSDAGLSVAVPDPTQVGAGTYYIEATNLNCSASEMITVVQNPTPVLDPIDDIVACDSYDLPATITGTDLSGNQGYFAQTGGVSPLSGTLTTSQTVFVYDDNNGCTDETSFTVTINITDDPTFTHVDHCEGDANLATVTGTMGCLLYTSDAADE